MIKKCIYFFIMCICSISIFNCPSPISSSPPSSTPLPTPSALWQTRLGSNGFDYGYSIVSGSYSIAAGQVVDNVNFNGDGDTDDPGEAALTGATAGTADAFVSLNDLTTGAHVWARRIGGTVGDFAYAVAANSNFIAVTGVVNGDADLDADGTIGEAGVNGEVRGAGFDSSDIFVSIFDYSGSYLWSRRIGSASFDSGFAAAIDKDLNLILTGYVTGNADLNGDGTMGGAESGESATGYGGYDIFVVSFGLAGTGTYNWSKRLGGADNDIGNAVKTDSTGQVVVTGYVRDDVDMDGDGIIGGGVTGETGLSNSDIFVSVFSSAGTHQWSKRLGGGADDAGRGIAIDGTYNNIFISGDINGYGDLSGDNDTNETGESASGYLAEDAFVVSFTSGGVYNWSKRLGASGADSGYAITTDGNGNVFVAGWVNGAADMNGDAAQNDPLITAESSTYGVADAYVSAFTIDGAFLWAIRLGGLASDHIKSVTADASNHILVTGNVNGNADLNGDGDLLDDSESVSFGDTDIFLVDFVQP